jgi:predicted small metal-binding protein
VDGIGSGLGVDPCVAERHSKGRPPVDALAPQHPPDLGDEGVESAVGGSGRFGPDDIHELGPADRPVPVAGEVGEQELSLPAWQVPVEALGVTLDDERAAQVDPERRRPSHANIVAIRPRQRVARRASMARIIRCECGFVARGDSDEKVIETIRGHMRTDHPALLDSVSREDLLGWMQVE